jgi:hypoxanthine phosphoribosyltransferase
MAQVPAVPGLDILITEDAIRRRVAELAAEIRRDTPGELHLVAALKGAFVFLADLIRALPGPVTLDFITTSSYGAATMTSGEIRLLQDVVTPIEGRDVVIVEDIVDTGLTLAYLRSLFAGRKPRSLRAACLLSKPARRRTKVLVDYVGFAIEDRFVVGYGLDYDGLYRNLPYLATLDVRGARV